MFCSDEVAVCNKTGSLVSDLISLELLDLEDCTSDVEQILLFLVFVVLHHLLCCPNLRFSVVFEVSNSFLQFGHFMMVKSMFVNEKEKGFCD